ncbi:DUF1102 domain-containing protein [Halopiger xanaduensis]|uniref:DUF1102 domain-containing protein n=1 Tax=Halopiger xanaduensis (strain DSM 18323 / JCM 14033 / SH-6) TaxID=797210 RepID=F8DAF8_HALXS|nr:DUF1102 domain-containing protein [Halopiger xanaduensis]AEH38163.1 hypothetical protein Halxa_3552 [Halopiger xanaduensis SH-6]
MHRRKFVIGVGSLAAGSAAAIGTGAFDSVEAERTVTAELADDADAYLALESSSSHSEVDPNGRLKIFDINGITNDGGGHGVGGNSEYHFDGVFEVTNQGTDTVHFYVGGLGTFVNGNDELANVYVYEDGARDTPLDGDAGALQIDSGTTESIGVYVETGDVDVEPDGSTTNSYNGTATVYAEIDDPTN